MVYRDGSGKILDSEPAARRELRRRLGGHAVQTPRSVSALLIAYMDTRGVSHAVELAERFATWAQGDYAALATLPASTLVDYAAWLRRQTTVRGTPFAPKSVKHYVSAAAQVLQWGTDRGYVTVAIRRPRLPKSPPNPKPIARLIHAGVVVISRSGSLSTSHLRHFAHLQILGPLGHGAAFGVEQTESSQRGHPIG